MVTGSVNRSSSITISNSPYTVPNGINKVNVDTTGGNVRINLPSTNSEIQIAKTSSDSYIVTLWVAGTQIGEVAGELSSVTVESGQITKDEPWYPYDAIVGIAGVSGDGGEVLAKDRYGRVIARGVAGANDAATINAVTGNMFVRDDIHPEGVINVVGSIEFNHKSTIYPIADGYNIFYMKPGGKLINPRVDCRGISFTKSVFFFDGKERFGEYSNTEIKRASAWGDLTGTCLLLESDEAVIGSIYGVYVELYINKFEYGCRFRTTGTFSQNYINGNKLRISGAHCVNFITQLPEGDAAMAGNSFFVDFSWGPSTLTGITIEGSYNKVYPNGLIWDVPTWGTALRFGPLGKNNFAICPTIGTRVIDLGTDNIVLGIGDTLSTLVTYDGDIVVHNGDVVSNGYTKWFR